MEGRDVVAAFPSFTLLAFYFANRFLFLLFKMTLETGSQGICCRRQDWALLWC